MTSAPPGRSANPYATYVDLDAAQQPRDEYPAPPPPPAYAPPPPPVAYFLPPDRPRRARVGRWLAIVASVAGMLTGSVAVKLFTTEKREKSQACAVIPMIVQDFRRTEPGTGQAVRTAVTAEDWAQLITTPVDPQLAADQRRQDARNRHFAAGLVFDPALRSALTGIADDTDGLIAVRQDVTGDAGARARRGAGLMAGLDGHVRAAQSACGQTPTGIVEAN
ncbi:hypothetical protein [Dactylosporangium matsuzakiense]|uniref:Uncharacterized protein n=1 Tax=Dactylosporangium matsuzakiense TaxID=53360 RepID=A0A9W6KN23_9ACTN|nr:hypothetical protein [Dactylosporangium matsuzakiense]UWZ41595.1 hypothetical protein Dmats_28540 [Dactylosporangium matsuzakiense]GLL02334.1 hypothetical protein GCM10017581_040760 [Dactylosporangium matsuzakiense]